MKKLICKITGHIKPEPFFSLRGYDGKYYVPPLVVYVCDRCKNSVLTELGEQLLKAKI